MGAEMEIDTTIIRKKFVGATGQWWFEDPYSDDPASLLSVLVE